MTPTDPAALCSSTRDGYTCVLPIGHAGEHRALGSEQDSYSQPRRWNDGDPRVRTMGQSDPAASRSEQAEAVERLREALKCRHGHAHYCPNCDNSINVESLLAALSAPCGACAERQRQQEQRPDPDAEEEWTPEELAEMRAEFGLKATLDLQPTVGRMCACGHSSVAHWGPRGQDACIARACGCVAFQ